MGWAVMLGHSGQKQKLGSDFKVLCVGVRRIRSDLGAFAEVNFWQCPGTRGERDLTFMQHLLCAVQVLGGQQFISHVVQLLKERSTLGYTFVETYLLVLKPAYVRVTLCHSHYSKDLSFSLTVHVNPHGAGEGVVGNLFLCFREEPYPNKGRMGSLTSVL